MTNNMKAVIFAGGYGTRFSEKTQYMPKPMIEIGGKPILWHIMKIYSAYGVKDFIICAGYKQYMIKEYFLNYFLHNSDMTVNLTNNSVKFHERHVEDWRVTIVDTGLETMTAGRLNRVRKYIGEEPFFLTYGDGVIDLDISKAFSEHKKSGAILTMTVFQPVGRFGAVEIDPKNDMVKSFLEKSDNSFGLRSSRRPIRHLRNGRKIFTTI